jgi:dihydrofolate reductase / thymidylate synthase
MALCRFNIIVAIDAGNGIAKNGEIPWYSKEDLKFFRECTMGKKRNVVIMGRLTYESIPEEHRPLEGRKCVVVSRTWKQEDHPEISIYASLGDAFAGIGGMMKSYDEIFVAGGEQIYREALVDYLYLCNKIYVTRFKSDYECTQYFPLDYVKDMDLFCEPLKTNSYVRYTYIPKITHSEHAYLDLLREVYEKGDNRSDRTGTGTRSLFALKMEFDISLSLPVITTKKVNYENIIKELLFFVSGRTDSRILENQGVNIWKKNTSKENIAKEGFTYNEGDMGPMYGFQWRHWGAEYKGCDNEYKGEGIDQLQNLVDAIRTDPFSRRHILSAWNVGQLSQMVLHPCHIFAQFYVSSDRKYLDCQIYVRSNDLFLGCPYNITSYAMLTYMIAHVSGLRPRKLSYVIGDAHIYNNHLDKVVTQLKRTPRPFPKLTFREASRIHSIDDFKFDSFIVSGYTSCQAIVAEMSV